MKKLIIIGAGGHGKVIADIAKKNGYDDIAFLDDNASRTECSGYSVIGTSKDVLQYTDRDFIVAIGNSQIRQKVQDTLAEAGVRVVTLVHPGASVGENVTLGEGTVVVAGAVINPDSKIGKGCIVNTCASVDHDCAVDDYSHVSVGAHVCGTVKVGKRVWIGAGATVINNVNICDDAIIGAGAVIISDVSERGTYAGVPAKKIK